MGALAILTVIFGVVTMHSMSGSPTAHLHHVPHEASVAPAERPTPEPAVVDRDAAQHAAPLGLASPVVDRSAAPPSDGDTAGQPGTGVCHDGCGGHDLATAMCLMILVAILALVVPARRLLWRAPIEWSMPLLLAPAGAVALGAPSLHELCISRT